jgi:hypothetical protein
VESSGGKANKKKLIQDRMPEPEKPPFVPGAGLPSQYRRNRISNTNKKPMIFSIPHNFTEHWIRLQQIAKLIGRKK